MASQSEKFRYVNYNNRNTQLPQLFIRTIGGQTYLNYTIISPEGQAWVDDIIANDRIFFFESDSDVVFSSAKILAAYDTTNGFLIEAAPSPALVLESVYEFNFSREPPADAIPTPPENRGWSPILALQTDGERVVARISDWVSGQGTKPQLGYLGMNGLVSDIADAVNVRGTPGLGGNHAQWTDGDTLPANPNTGDYHVFPRGVTISGTTYAANDVVRYDGANWVVRFNFATAIGWCTAEDVDQKIADAIDALAVPAEWAREGDTKLIPDAKFRHKYTINLEDSRNFEYRGVNDLVANQREFRIHTQQGTSRDYIMIGGLDYDNARVVNALRAGSRIGIFTNNNETAYFEMIGRDAIHGIEIRPDATEKAKLTSGNSYRIRLAEIGVPKTDDPARIKELYESNADTNAFTDAFKTIVESLRDNVIDGIKGVIDLIRRQIASVEEKTEDLSRKTGATRWRDVSGNPGLPEGSFVVRLDDTVSDADIEGITGWATQKTIPNRNPGDPSLWIVYRLPAVPSDQRGTGNLPSEAENALFRKYEILDGGDLPNRPRYRTRSPSDPQAEMRRITRHANQWIYVLESFTPLPGTGYHVGAQLNLQIYASTHTTEFKGDVDEAQITPTDGNNNIPESVNTVGKLVTWLNTAVLGGASGISEAVAQRIADARAALRFTDTEKSDLRKVVRNSYQRWQISPASPITQTGNGNVTTTLQFAEDDGKNVLGNNLPPSPLLEETPASINLKGLLRRSASDNGNAQIQVSTDERIIIDSTIDVESDDIEFSFGAVLNDVQDNRFSTILTTTNFQAATTITLDDVKLTVDELGDANESPKRLPFLPEVKIGNVIELTQPYRDPQDRTIIHQPGTYRCFTLARGYERIEYVKEGTIQQIHNSEAATGRGIDAADVNIGRNTSRIADIENSVDFDFQPQYLVRNNTPSIRVGLENVVPSFLSGTVIISLILFSEVHKATSQNGRLSGRINWTPGSAQRTFDFDFDSAERASISGHFEDDTHIGVALQFTGTSSQIYKTTYKNIPILLEPPDTPFLPDALLPTNNSRTHAQSRITLPADYTEYMTCVVVLDTSGTTRTFNITVPDMRLGLLGSSSTSDTENKTHMTWDATTRVLQPRESAGKFVSVTLYGRIAEVSGRRDFTVIHAVANIPSIPIKGDEVRIGTTISSNVPSTFKGRTGATETILTAGNQYVFDGTNWLLIGDGQASAGSGINATRAREIAAEVTADWAETGNTGLIPSSKLPAVSDADTKWDIVQVPDNCDGVLFSENARAYQSGSWSHGGGSGTAGHIIYAYADMHRKLLRWNTPANTSPHMVLADLSTVNTNEQRTAINGSEMEVANTGASDIGFVIGGIGSVWPSIREVIKRNKYAEIKLLASEDGTNFPDGKLFNLLISPHDELEEGLVIMGTTAPSNTLGNINDVYFRVRSTTDIEVLQKNNRGTWTARFRTNSFASALALTNLTARVSALENAPAPALDIHGLTAVTPTLVDEIVFSDVSDSNALKKTQIAKILEPVIETPHRVTSLPTPTVGSEVYLTQQWIDTAPDPDVTYEAGRYYCFTVAKGWERVTIRREPVTIYDSDTGETENRRLPTNWTDYEYLYLFMSSGNAGVRTSIPTSRLGSDVNIYDEAGVRIGRWDLSERHVIRNEPWVFHTVRLL